MLDEEIKAKRKLFESEMSQREKTLEIKYEDKQKKLDTYDQKLNTLENDLNEASEISRNKSTQVLDLVEEIVYLKKLSQDYNEQSDQVAKLQERLKSIVGNEDITKDESTHNTETLTELNEILNKFENIQKVQLDTNKKLTELHEKTDTIETKIVESKSHIDNLEKKLLNSPQANNYEQLIQKTNQLESQITQTDKLLKENIESAIKNLENINDNQQKLENRLNTTDEKLAKSGSFEDNIKKLEKVSIEFQNNLQYLQKGNTDNQSVDLLKEVESLKNLLDEKLKEFEEQRQTDQQTLEEGFVAHKNELLMQTQVGQSKFETEMNQEFRTIEAKANKMALQVEEKFMKKYSEIHSTLEKLKKSSTLSQDPSSTKEEAIFHNFDLILAAKHKTAISQFSDEMDAKVKGIKADMDAKTKAWDEQKEEGTKEKLSNLFSNASNSFEALKTKINL